MGADPESGTAVGMSDDEFLARSRPGDPATGPGLVEHLSRVVHNRGNDPSRSFRRAPFACRWSRRSLIGVAAATCLANGVPASAGTPHQTPNGDFSVLEMHISPPKAGTQRHPRGVSLAYHILKGNDLSGKSSSSPLHSEEIRLPKGMRFNLQVFPTCKYARLARSGPPACPSRSKIGFGDEWIDFRPVIPTFFSAACSAFNGRDSHSAPALLVWCKTDFGASGTIVYDVLPPARTAGPRLRYEQGSPSTGITPDYFGSNFTFPQASVKVRGRRVSLIDAPDNCHGSWLFSQVETGFDGKSVTVTDRQPCIP